MCYLYKLDPAAKSVRFPVVYDDTYICMRISYLRKPYHKDSFYSPCPFTVPFEIIRSFFFKTNLRFYFRFFFIYVLFCFVVNRTYNSSPYNTKAVSGGGLGHMMHQPPTDESRSTNCCTDKKVISWTVRENKITLNKNIFKAEKTIFSL